MNEVVAVKVSDRFRRLATTSAFASLFAFALTLTIAPAAINEISRFYTVSDAQLGWFFRAMMVGFFVAVLAAGRYSDRKGKLPILVAGSVLMGVGALALAQAASFTAAVAAGLLMGLGGGLSEGTAMAIIADVYGGARRTAMMNWTQVFFAIGAVAGPLGIAQLIAAKGDWRVGFVVTAAICAVSAIVSLIAASTREEKPLAHAHGGNWRKLIRDKMIFWLSLGILLYVGAESGQATWLAAYFKRDIGTAGPLAAASVALFWSGIMAGRAVATWAAKHLSDYALICISLSFAAICQATLLVVHSPMLALAAVPLLGFGLAPVWPTILSCAGAEYPTQSGTVFGIVVASGSLGSALFPPTIGQAADVIGLRTALWICFVLLAFNLAIFAQLWRGHRAKVS